jgi:hypothetical protein
MAPWSPASSSSPAARRRGGPIVVLGTDADLFVNSITRFSALKTDGAP